MIHAIPLLEKQRRLYDLPRGPERFEAYLDLMANGHPERLPTLPLQAMNPMAREHVAEHLDGLLAEGADLWLQAFATELNALLPDTPERNMCWVVADDLKGGWTHRHLTEASRCFELPRYHHGWIPVLLWVSDPISKERLRKNAFAGAFRHFYHLKHGAPTTLQQMLLQEGQALLFARETVNFSAEELEYTAEILQPHLQSTHFPTLFACMYGDGPAKAVGYAPLGLSDGAGFEYALAREMEQMT